MNLSFGVVSDTHLCGKAQKLDELCDFYNWVSRYTNKVYHAGDLTDGKDVYKGQENNVFIHGVDKQVDYVVKNYPKIRGLLTRVISGNHDLRQWEKCGVDAVRQICDKRDDFQYKGRYKGEIVYPFGRLWLVHPAGGIAYAHSYPAQKYLRQMSDKMKPKILVMGHRHVGNFFMERGVYVLGAGAFQGENDFTMRRGLVPDVGGWLIDLEYEGRTITRFKPTWKGYK